MRARLRCGNCGRASEPIQFVYGDSIACDGCGRKFLICAQSSQSTRDEHDHSQSADRYTPILLEMDEPIEPASEAPKELIGDVESDAPQRFLAGVSPWEEHRRSRGARSKQRDIDEREQKPRRSDGDWEMFLMYGLAGLVLVLLIGVLVFDVD